MLQDCQTHKSSSSSRRNPSAPSKNTAAPSILVSHPGSENCSWGFHRWEPFPPLSSSNSSSSDLLGRLQSKPWFETWFYLELPFSGHCSLRLPRRPLLLLRQLRRPPWPTVPWPPILQRQAPTWACDKQPCCGTRFIAWCRRRCRRPRRRPTRRRCRQRRCQTSRCWSKKMSTSRHWRCRIDPRIHSKINSSMIKLRIRRNRNLQLKKLLDVQN